MNDIVLARPTKTSAYLVTFTWGDPSQPHQLRVTDWTASITLLGVSYASIPTMEIAIPANTAGMDESPFQITLPLNAFTAGLSIGEPHASVDVEVREYVVGERDSLASIIYVGVVDVVTRNPEGTSGAVRLDIVNAKSRLDVSLGIQANTTCAWIVGTGPCTVDVQALAEDRRIIAIDSALITLDALTVSTSWRRGYVELDGLRVGIRDHGGALLRLVRPPPRAWLDQVVHVVPGCDGSLSTCRDAWNNELQFMGAGYAIPDYHPVIEAP